MSVTAASRLQMWGDVKETRTKQAGLEVGVEEGARRPTPRCVPAETQTAKDSSCRDLMTHVISLREMFPPGVARPVSPGPHLFQNLGDRGPSLL